MKHVRVEQRGDVALVRIDRPPANALDLSLLEEGHGVLADLGAAEPGAVVLTGRDGFFSAGVDLKLVPTLDAAAQRAMVGGMILALCGDHRVGARTGRYGLTELAVGVPYPVVALAVVRGELTAPAARRLALGAELVGPEEAFALGVFDELVAPEDVLPRALEAAERLAKLPS